MASELDDGGPAELPLVKGGVAIVSAIDLPILSKSKWQLNSQGYVCRVGEKLKGTPFLLHRIVTGASRGEEVHHRDEVKTNCRRPNLEVTTPSEHQRYHSHLVIARNKASRVYPLTGTCKACGNHFVRHRDHRGQQVCCSKRCAITLAVAARQQQRKSAAMPRAHSAERSE